MSNAMKLFNCQIEHCEYNICCMLYATLWLYFCLNIMAIFLSIIVTLIHVSTLWGYACLNIMAIFLPIIVTLTCLNIVRLCWQCSCICKVNSQIRDTYYEPNSMSNAIKLFNCQIEHWVSHLPYVICYIMAKFMSKHCEPFCPLLWH